jgi:SAM-dependent methyltransferase
MDMLRLIAGHLLALYFRAAREQAFAPAWWGLLVNPFFIARRLLHAQIEQLAASLEHGTVLDIGCGSRPYRNLFRAETYLGVDLPRAHGRGQGPDVAYDGTALPFALASVDHALMTEVLEHVFEPERLLGEVHRVLRPGGTLLLTVPFSWDEHEQPFDYARYSSFGIRSLVTRCGFSVAHVHKNGNAPSTLLQLLSSYVDSTVRRRHVLLRMLVTAVVCAPILLVGHALGSLPLGDDLYLDNVVLAHKRPLS